MPLKKHRDTVSAEENVTANSHKHTVIITVTLVLVIIAVFAAVYLSKSFFDKNSPNESNSDSDTVTEEFIPSAETPEDAAEAYIHAIAVERSVDALTACVHEDIISAYVESNYDGNYDDFKSMLGTSFSLLADVTTTYSLSPSRELSEDEFAAVEEYYENAGSYSFAAVDAYLTLKGTMSDTEVDEADSSTYITVQIDGKWYVDLRLVR